MTSAAEDKFLSGPGEASRIDLFIDGHGPWLGAYERDSKAEPGGDWAWVTGERFTFTHWNPGEPDNKTGGEPGFEPGIKAGQSEEVLQYLASRFWNDANVTAQAHGYVVEFDKPRQAACRGVQADARSQRGLLVFGQHLLVGADVRGRRVDDAEREACGRRSSPRRRAGSSLQPRPAPASRA